MAARISDRISARNLANDEPIQAYEADGVTVVDLLKVNASDQISIAVDGQDVVIGGTVNARNIATDGAKLDGIEVSADVTDTANVVGALTAGTNITIAANGTIASTDTNTTYSIGDGGLTTNDFTNADHTKLDGIAIGANNYTLPAGYATETYVGTQISNLVDSSPAALNTLNELAAAIGDDANFSTTVTNNIATKLPLAGGTLTGNLNVTGATTINANIANPLTINATLDGIAYSEIFNISTGASAAAYFGIVTQNLANSGTIRSGMFFDSSNHLNFINGEAGGAGIVLDDNNAVTMAGALNVSGNIEASERVRLGNNKLLQARNQADTQWRSVLKVDTNNDLIIGSSATPITLNVDTNVTGDVKASGAFTRSLYNSGYLEGGYNNVGASSTDTGPIYIIGSGYQPFATTLNNMYGIGYAHTNASFINFTGQSGWGMYVASAGVAKVWLGSDNGVISSTGEHYVGANKVWHAGDAVVAATATSALRFMSTSHNGTYHLVNNWDNTYWHITSNHGGQNNVRVARADTAGSATTATTATALTAGAKTIAGNLTVGNTTSSNIYMQDTDEGYRTLHCNSNRIGFLTAAGAWSAYSTDAGVWSCDVGLTVTGTSNLGGGLIIGRVATSATVAANNDGGSMSIRGNTTKPAVISFHRAGAYAVNFGLSTANKMELGGWSASSIKHTWDFAGNYTATGNITAYSDIRIKENIEVIPEALDKVCQLSGYTFDRTDFAPDAETGVMPETRQTGVIAQEVLKVLPEAVAEMDDGKLTVAYGNMVGLLIESIKELKAEIDTLKTQLDIS